MNAPPDTATRQGAFLALALADALTLGLPDPGYITMHPNLARSTTTSAAGFQFSSWGGRDPLPAMQAWASRFGVTVAVSTSADDPSETWYAFDFTHAGVLIHAYASVAAACACGHPKDSHWEHGEPDGTRTGCGKVGCQCAAYAPAREAAEAVRNA